MCQDLDCGSVYHVNKSSSPADAACFHHCAYGDGRLQNCSQSAAGNCSVITEAVCGHQAVRLAGHPSDRCAGRVELWSSGRWGTVCDDQWDLRDADVVCGQLGCGYALSVTGQGGSFPPGRGPVLRDELNCTGREENLWACAAAPDQSDCGHKEDAGVVCSEMRAVRLTGGLDRCSGKVEVHRNGSWGTVCDHCWNVNLARMVCSMLRCGAQPHKYSQFLPPLAHNSGTLWFYQCDRNMQNLWQCEESFDKPHLCVSSKASGLICNGSLGFPAATTTSSTAATTANATQTTSWTTGARAEDFHFPSPELLSAVALVLLLLVVLVTNTVLCCHYRRRHAFLLQQTRSSARPPSELHRSSKQAAVDLVKVTPNPLDAEDSQRYRPDVNPLTSLFEEAPDEVMGVFSSCNGNPAEAQSARVSTISEDSFDTSSTSSGEYYENTNDGYVVVTPEPGPGQSAVAYSKDRQTTHLHSSANEDEGPVYSPVSPERNPSSDSEDDYDDIGS